MFLKSTESNFFFFVFCTVVELISIFVENIANYIFAKYFFQKYLVVGKLALGYFHNLKSAPKF